MSKLHEIPLKVLWIWNQNENKIVVDFYLQENEKPHQVKGAGVNALDPKGNLLICSTENLNAVSQVSFENKVLIKNGNIIEDIWTYWNQQGGEKEFKQLLNAVINAQQRIEIPPVPKEKKNITLSSSQLNDLVFEMEALLEMKRVLKGEVPIAEIEGFIKNCTAGFSEETKEKVRNELRRKNLIK